MEETLTLLQVLLLVPTLPLDIIAEILCRLPVKLLLQLRCVCKSWNALITDPDFAKKHLSMSATSHLHFMSYTTHSGKYNLTSYPLHSVFTDITTNFTQFEYSMNNFDEDYPRGSFHDIIGSCNGILCIADIYKGLAVLWNPSIRKVKELPLFEKPHESKLDMMSFGFGYDSFTDNYKVVVVFEYHIYDRFGMRIRKSQVKVHTLGTNFWKNIQDFPFDGVLIEKSGKFVSGTLNWLASFKLYRLRPCFIVSLDLKNESYQKVLLPDFGDVTDVCTWLTMSVFRDCLCVTTGHEVSGKKDVWVMKEHGNKESWTKLFTIPKVVDHTISYAYVKPVYSFEDNRVLLKFTGNFELNLFVYDYGSGCRCGAMSLGHRIPLQPVC
ncbi:F-box/kelch-repeat protein [Trifolium pratense]|uniref:F-box/kelch-repeat protein n=1 Tax=Trifolium pratense TaxID=57577 RepID=A0A2K3LYM5_TRIPR|nr:F-box/kelch-repeat protein [Trifolium pratense]